MNPMAASGPAASAPVAAADAIKLARAAQQFEAILIQSLLETSQRAMGPEPESDPAATTLKDMGLQAVATALSASGGLGIGRLILAQLKPAGGDSLP